LINVTLRLNYKPNHRAVDLQKKKIELASHFIAYLWHAFLSLITKVKYAIYLLKNHFLLLQLFIWPILTVIAQPTFFERLKIKAQNHKKLELLLVSKIFGVRLSL